MAIMTPLKHPNFNIHVYMELLIYRISLALAGLMNLGMALMLLRGTSKYQKYPTYQMTRVLTVIWLVVFALGYMIHAVFLWRYTWPSAASALTATYFHIGAICFNWGYTSLLNTDYLKKGIVIRDTAFFIFGITSYWTVALCWDSAPTLTALSFCVFFIYAVLSIIIFYRTYNHVSYRMLKMSLGSVGSFVRWMQVCCDLIILFGMGSVAITGIFPNSLWPYVILLFFGVGMFGYIVYSLEKYGNVIDDATKFTRRITVNDRVKGKSKHRMLFHIIILLMTTLSVTAMSSCTEEQQTNHQEIEADSLIDEAYKTHDYERILSLADEQQQAGTLNSLKACYWRGYAHERMRNMRLAESEWKEAVEQSVKNDEDLEYYSKSVNRLTGLLYKKFEYEGTIRVATPAIKFLEEKDYTLNTDYANLHTFVGNCQLNLGEYQKATDNFSLAYETYQKVIESDDNIANYTSAIVGIINITNSYLQLHKYHTAYDWIERFATMLEKYREHPQANETFIDKQWARLNLYRAWALEGLDYKDQAKEAYQMALATHYAKTAEGQIEATYYLMAAHRWGEAADRYEELENLLNQYDMKMTLDDIRAYLLPKYMANVEAQRKDSAIAVGMRICHLIDTAIVWERQNAAIELATIYDMQQKEKEIVEQRADLTHQRYRSAILTLFLVVLGFCIFIYFRYQSAMRLESAYHDLEVATARAEESSRIKSEFIQQISHEIRTPLNILSGYTQIITTPDIELDETTRQDINQQVIENTNRLTGLVNKMLELSDARSQTIIERSDNVKVIQIASEAVDVSDIDNAKHLTFRQQIAPEVAGIVLQTNLSAAVRALSLLLDNACKFTAPAEAETTKEQDTLQHKQYAALRLDVTRDMVQFIVEDTGIGVPVEEADRIFEEFVQLDEYYDGTGIGLTVARSMARRLGGDIVLDTSYTEGARFVMTLPKSA